jgi:hypothetical protein
MRLDEVRPRHLRDLVLDLRKAGTLAPRTIRHVYAILTTMFRNAVADELILATPCVLAPGVLPKKVDKDPAFRANAIFTREELEQLIADPRILEDRRILYALKGLAAPPPHGGRHPSLGPVRYRPATTRLPLAREDQDQDPRQIPVHPALARLLADWQAAGWERTNGRPPTPTDLIVPTRNDTSRAKAEAQHALLQDLAASACAPAAATTSAAPSSPSPRSTAPAAISSRP